MNANISIPQPEEVTSAEKESAGSAYLMMFASWFFSAPLPLLNLLFSFIYYQFNKRKSRFIAFHAHQSLVSQVVVTFSVIIAVGWTIRALIPLFQGKPYEAWPYWAGYLVLAAVYNVYYLIISIIAMYNAYHGRFFYMPLFGRFSFDTFYGPNAVSLEKHEPANRAPA